MRAVWRGWAVALSFGVVGTATAADAEGFYGLLRARDLTPFGYLRLDVRPAHAVSIEPHHWVVETELAYQNTWALSPRVESYLESLPGRRELGPAEYAAIRALPGENYLIDLEAAQLDVTFHYKFASNWSGYVTLSGASYQGGFLDSMIEAFHDDFGFSTFGRPAVTRNDVNVLLDLKSSQIAYFSAPSHGGVLDPTLGIRYTGIPMPERWRLTLETAVKPALSGRSVLLSTGRTDVGAQASLQRLGDRHAFYVDVAVVAHRGGTEPAVSSSQTIPTLILGYEYKLTGRTNINLQGYASPSVYSRKETDLHELLATKLQASLGVRHRLQRSLISFAVTENLQNFNNTPDIGFQLGWAWLPAM